MSTLYHCYFSSPIETAAQSAMVAHNAYFGSPELNLNRGGTRLDRTISLRCRLVAAISRDALPGNSKYPGQIWKPIDGRPEQPSF
jgi:hypothetical protein